MKIASFVLVAIMAVLSAYGTEKKPLTYNDLMKWNNLNSHSISNDGNIVAYKYSPLLGDAKVVAYTIKTNTSDTLNCATDFKLSPESNFIIAKISTPYDSVRQCKINKVPKKKMPKDSVGIFIFKTHEFIKYPKLKNYKVGKDEGFWAAILVEKDAFKKEEKKDTSATSSEIKEKNVKEEEVPEKTEEEEEEVKPKGDVLILFNSRTNDTITFKSVTEYIVSDKNNQIAFVTEYEDSLLRSDIVIFDTKEETIDSIFHYTGKIKKLVFDKLGNQLSFLGSTDTCDVKTYSLYYTAQKNTPTIIVDSLTMGIPDGYSPSEFRTPFFSENGKSLYLGTAPKPIDESNDSIPTDEIPKLDVWSWTDLRLQPQQKLKVKEDKNKNYLAVWDITNKRLLQLASEKYASVSLTPKKNSKFALVSNELPYLRESNWTGQWCSDLSTINLENGEIDDVSQKQHRYRLSAGGNFVIWYNAADTAYYSYNNNNSTIVNLTSSLPVKIYNELEDHPILPSTYGIAGWTTNDKYVLIYDRYDIWKLDPTGIEKPILLTNGSGRNSKVEYRIIDIDDENEFVDLDQTLLLKATNQETNEQFYCSYNYKKEKLPKELYGGAYHLSTPKKAKNTNNVIWTFQNFQTFPDIVYSNTSFKKTISISKINPQQSDYLWGTVEAVEWTSFRNEQLKGLLYKPENFDPSKKYPIIVYFYERNFHTQHYHNAPSPSRSIINKTFYASNGYLVFVPDITYTDGYPGQSAYDAVISGVNYLSSTHNYINREKMGLQGQSWGGYQIAYLVTQTNMFAAAMAGAPVSNMTSAYGGIRWGSGLNRMFQYEKTQSRIGGTLWEKPIQYIENSPLFFAPKITTPLLMMHNDNDGAVPWYQGIELFVAMRRLDKPAWLLSYNDEPHNLKADSWANRLDLSKRMKQFFDHYLKDEPVPEWMETGIPAIRKGIELRY